MQLLAIESTNELELVLKNLKKLESKTANQTALPVIGAAITLIGIAHNIPRNMASMSLDLCASYLDQIESIVGDLSPNIMRLKRIAEAEYR